MAEFAKSVLKKTLNVKYPDFFALHFSECILVLNDCTGNNDFVLCSEVLIITSLSSVHLIISIALYLFYHCMMRLFLQ